MGITDTYSRSCSKHEKRAGRPSAPEVAALRSPLASDRLPTAQALTLPRLVCVHGFEGERRYTSSSRMRCILSSQDCGFYWGLHASRCTPNSATTRPQPMAAVSFHKWLSSHGSEEKSSETSAAKPARPRLCRRVFFTKEHIVLVFGNNFMRSHHFARWKTASFLIIPQDQRSVSFWKRMRLETIIHNAENISLEESEHIRSVWPVPRPHRLQLTTTKIREKRI